jgi:hypothetical protein
MVLIFQNNRCVKDGIAVGAASTSVSVSWMSGSSSTMSTRGARGHARALFARSQAIRDHPLLRA